jgi:hypothetical protein
MSLSSSHDLTVNGPYAHLLPEYRHRLEVSLSAADDATILAWFMLCEIPSTSSIVMNV